MLRLLAFVVLAVAPLLASAHGGHHSATAGTPAPVAAEANGTVRAIVAAPSRCPGGEESCCCHDAACTPFQPVAIDAQPAMIGAAPARTQKAFHPANEAPRAVAAVRYPPRGPPVRS